MNHPEAVAARLEANHPRWKAWFVPRAVGGYIWAAQRWDGSDPVLNAASPEELAALIEREDRPYPDRPMDTSDIDPDTGEAWGVDPTDSGEQS
jgi:hypothetical protein